MTHLTIMPPILIYFARERALAAHHEQHRPGRAPPAGRVRRAHAAGRAAARVRPGKEHTVTIAVTSRIPAALPAAPGRLRAAPRRPIDSGPPATSRPPRSASRPRSAAGCSSSASKEGDRVAAGDVDRDARHARRRPCRWRASAPTARVAEAQLRLVRVSARASRTSARREAQVDAAEAEVAAARGRSSKPADLDLERFESLLARQRRARRSSATTRAPGVDLAASGSARRRERVRVAREAWRACGPARGPKRWTARGRASAAVDARLATLEQEPRRRRGDRAGRRAS